MQNPVSTNNTVEDLDQDNVDAIEANQNLLCKAILHLPRSVRSRFQAAASLSIKRSFLTKKGPDESKAKPCDTSIDIESPEKTQLCSKSRIHLMERQRPRVLPPTQSPDRSPNFRTGLVSSHSSLSESLTPQSDNDASLRDRYFGSLSPSKTASRAEISNARSVLHETNSSDVRQAFNYLSGFIKSCTVCFLYK